MSKMNLDGNTSRSAEDAEALVSSLRKSVWGDKIGGYGGKESALQGQSKGGDGGLSAYLLASFREEHALVQANAALKVRMEAMSRESADAGAGQRQIGILEERIRAKDAEMVKADVYWQGQMRDLKATLFSAQLEDEQLKSENSELRGLLASCEEEKKTCEARVKDLSDVIEKQKKEIEANKQMLSQLSQQQAPSDGGLVEAVRVLQSEEVEALRGQIEQLQMRCESLKARASSQEALAREAQKNLKLVTQENHDIIESLKAADREKELRDSIGERNKMLEQRAAQLAADAEGLRADRDVKHAVLTALEARLSAESSEHAKARVDLEEARRAMDALKQEMGSKARLYFKSDTEIVSLRGQLEDALTMLAASRQECITNGAKAHALEQRVADLNSDCEKSRVRANEMLDRLGAVAEQLEESQRERRALLGDVKRLESGQLDMVGSLQQQLRLCREQLEAAERRAVQAEQRVEALRGGAELLQRARDEAEKEALQASERWLDAKMEIERASQRKHLYEKEVAQRHEQWASWAHHGNEALRRARFAEAQLYDCEAALARAEDGAENSRASLQRVNRLISDINMSEAQRRVLEQHVRALAEQLHKAHAMEAELLASMRGQDETRAALVGALEEARGLREENAQLRRDHHYARSALQGARKQNAQLQREIDLLNAERQNLVGGLQAAEVRHNDVVRAMTAELEQARKAREQAQAQVEAESEDKARLVKSMQMEMSKLKLRKQST